MMVDGAINDGRITPPPSPNPSTGPGPTTTSLRPPNTTPARAPLPSELEPFPHDYAPSMADELAQTIGLPLTRHNAVWGPFALDKLRELQHTLMKHAFDQVEGQRQAVLNAVKVVEVAVTLRLRLEEAAQQEILLLQEKADKAQPERVAA